MDLVDEDAWFRLDETNMRDGLGLLGEGIQFLAGEFMRTTKTVNDAGCTLLRSPRE
jgi:hypothetical protein